MNARSISVVIPTYRRIDKLLDALEHIRACSPEPDEIIIHIDGDDDVTKMALQSSKMDDISVITSKTQQGPGGGRNRAIAQAKHEIVASFDDDSYPIDKDYFARLLQLFEQFPKAAVIGAAIYHIGETVESDEQTAQWEHSFIGCGCAYRKSVFQAVEGYVPLPVAYGMEEVDLSLRLHHADWGVLVSPWLRVFHNTQLEHHGSAKVTAASISNQAMLTYLRYPPFLWWIGLGQCLSRIVWLSKHNRRAGILKGIIDIPKAAYQQRASRRLVSGKSLRSFLDLKRQTVHVKLAPSFTSASGKAQQLKNT